MEMIWEYKGKEDLMRTHVNKRLFFSKKSISNKTIQQIEYRWSSFGKVKITGITPRGQKENKISLPVYLLKQDNSYSEIKFYFNYPASKATEQKPKKLFFTLKKNKKLIKTRLLVGWYCQNPDGMQGYMKSVSIIEKDIVIPPDTDGKGFIIPIELTESDYQRAACNETETSFNFLYFVLWQKDKTYTLFKFGEKMQFDAYII